MIHGGNVWEEGNPEKWLDFSANLRPEGPPAWVTEAISRALSEMRYYPDLSMRAARRGLAAYAGVEEDHMLPTAGGMAAIDLALRMRNGPVRVETPSFGEYARRAAVLGRTVRTGNQPEARGETRFICNPHNPTGTALSRNEILAVHRSAVSAGGELIVDEAFIDYCPECSVRREVSDTLTVVGSLTKILCIPGVRLGYVCASPEKIRRLEKLALPWQLNYAAAAVAAALPEHLDQMRLDAEQNAGRREKMAQELRKLGVAVQPSRANFLLGQFPCSMRAAVEQLKAQQMLVRTCESFGLPDCWLRLAVRTEAENRKLIRALSCALDAEAQTVEGQAR